MLHYSSDDFSAEFVCDRLAVDDSDQILLVSVAGPATSVKAFAAAMQSNVPVRLRVSDVEWDRGYHSYLRKDGDGYTRHLHHLGFGTWHLMLVSNRRGFLPSLDEESLWQKLQHFTTPLLKRWVPTLQRLLQGKDMLTSCDAVDCNPGLLTVEESDLDGLVSEALRRGSLTIN